MSLHKLLIPIFFVASALFLGCSHPKTETCTVGEFSFDYPSGDFVITARDTVEKMHSFIITFEKKPFNRIEFAVYRYEPDFVATIVPKELMGELRADVIEVSHRATDGLEIKSQEGRISPEDFPSSRTVDNLMAVADTTGTEAFVRVTSTQIQHYNIITVAWSETREMMDKFMEIYSSFRVVTEEADGQ